jgi:hypothetical protein
MVGFLTNQTDYQAEKGRRYFHMEISSPAGFLLPEITQVSTIEKPVQAAIEIEIEIEIEIVRADNLLRSAAG